MSRYLEQWSPTTLAPGTISKEDNFSTDQSGSGRQTAQVVMQVMGAADEALVTCPPLTSCCAVCFLIDGAGDPWLRGKLDMEMLDHTS